MQIFISVDNKSTSGLREVSLNSFLLRHVVTEIEKAG